MLFRIAGRDLQLPRLIGAFLLFAALMMFVRAGADMFDSWDAIKDTRDCFTECNAGEQCIIASGCEQKANNLGLYIKSGQTELSNRQFWSALLGPIANLFVWAVVFLIGLMFYRTGDIIIPIEQTVHEIPEAVPKYGDKKRK